MEKNEQLTQELQEVRKLVAVMTETIQYLSQRVAWSDTCFKQVQDSGVMQMASMTKQVMLDHKKLQSQFSILSMRISALIAEDGSGSSGDSPPTPPGISTRKFGR